MDIEKAVLVVPCQSGFSIGPEISLCALLPCTSETEETYRNCENPGNESGFFCCPNSEIRGNHAPALPKPGGFLWAVAPRPSHSQTSVMTSVFHPKTTSVTMSAALGILMRSCGGFPRRSPFGERPLGGDQVVGNWISFRNALKRNEHFLCDS